MILRELLLKLGLEVDEAAFAKGELAASLLKAGFEKIVEVVQETAHEFVELINKTVESGVEILELSKATGVSTDALQDLMTAAAFTGVSVDQLKIGIFTLSHNMYAAANGSEEAQKAFTKLGIKVKDSHGKLRSADEVLLDVADKFKEMPDGVQKSALSMEVFGKAGKNMIEMLSEGREGIEELAAETPNLTTEQLKASKEIEKTQRQLSLTMENLWQRAIGPLLPAINELLKRYLAWKKAGAELMRQRIEKWLGYVLIAIGKIATVAGWVVDAFDMLVNVGKMLITFVIAIGKGFKFLYDQLLIVKIMLGWAGLYGAIWLFAQGSIVAAAKTAAAWLLAAAPFIAIGVAVAALLLIMDDLNAYAEGRDSLFGRVVESIDKWLRIKPEDSNFMRGIKWFVQQLRDAVQILVELDDIFGDGSKARAMTDRQAAANSGQMSAEKDAMVFQGARKGIAQGRDLTANERKVLARHNIPEAAFIAKYKGTGEPEYQSPATAAAANASGAGSGVLLSAPATINVYPPAGSSPEDIAKATKQEFDEHTQSEWQEASAGTSY